MSSDAALAFFIGALVGVGAALLLESGDDDDDASVVMRQLRQQGLRVHFASRRESRQLRNAIAVARRVWSRD
jgi:hypothetical protein